MKRFTDRFKLLCQAKGTSPHKVAQEVGENTTLVSEWINNKRTPTIDRTMELLKNLSKSETLGIDFATLAAWWAADYIPSESFEIGAEQARQAEGLEKREIS